MKTDRSRKVCNEWHDSPLQVSLDLTRYDLGTRRALLLVPDPSWLGRRALYETVVLQW